MAVRQTRAFFKSKYGKLVDNPAIGKVRGVCLCGEEEERAGAWGVKGGAEARAGYGQGRRPTRGNPCVVAARRGTRCPPCRTIPRR